MTVSGATVVMGKLHHTSKFIFKASGEKFYYNYTTEGHVANEWSNVEAAFDGEHTYRFTPSDSTMAIFPGNSKIHPWTRDVNPLYFLYSFIPLFPDGESFAPFKDGESYTAYFKIMPVTALFSKAIDIKSIIANSKIIKEDSEALTIATPSLLEPLIGANTVGTPTTQVFLDKTHDFFPVGWRKEAREAETGVKRSLEFKVTEQGAIAYRNNIFRYPKKSTITVIDEGESVPESAIYLSIDSIAVDAELSDGSFQLDPKKASHIEDSHGHVITVPK
jgi:hypothetical protein